MPILKNADWAIIDERKIRDYVLNPNHPRGRHKAPVLRAATGLTRAHFANLIEQVRRGIVTNEAEPIGPTPYGERFRVAIAVTGPAGTARIRTGWIYRRSEDVPRLTTVYLP